MKPLTKLSDSKNWQKFREEIESNKTYKILGGLDRRKDKEHLEVDFIIEQIKELRKAKEFIL